MYNSPSMVRLSYNGKQVDRKRQNGAQLVPFIWIGHCQVTFPPLDPLPIDACQFGELLLAQSGFFSSCRDQVADI